MNGQAALSCLRQAFFARSYIGYAGPGLSRSNMRRPKRLAERVPNIDRSEYVKYLDRVDRRVKTVAECSEEIRIGDLPSRVPGAMPSGFVAPPKDIPDLPYYIWRRPDDERLPVRHIVATKTTTRKYNCAIYDN